MIFYYLDTIPNEVNWWGMFIRDCKQFLNLKPLSKYNAGDGGIVLIEERNWRNDENLVFKIIEEYSNRKDLYFMLCDTSEGYPTRYLYHPFFDFLESCGIEKHRRILMYNNALYPKQVKESEKMYTFYYPSFLYEFANMHEHPDKEASKYDFSCFNRRGKEHKLETVKEILNRNLNCATTWDLFNDSEFTHDSFLKTSYDENNQYLQNKDYFLGKINICTESEFYSTYHEKATAASEHQWDDMIHLTEKVFRNIAWGIPYVLISSKGSLNEIRRLGLKTFNSIIDENYDNLDDSIRINSSLDTANELLKKHNSVELNDILEYNIKKIKEYKNDIGFFNEEILLPLKKHINNLVI